MELRGGGIRIDLLPGWDGSIDTGTVHPVPQAAGTEVVRDGPIRRSVVHAASFPLPAGRGDFGNGAVQLMEPGDVFISLFEYGPESTERRLFRSEGLPVVDAAHFDPAALQKPVPGGSASQYFFQLNGRAFCLYVVVGSHIDRHDALASIRRIVASLVVE